MYMHALTYADESAYVSACMYMDALLPVDLEEAYAAAATYSAYAPSHVGIRIEASY
jgi:hypothetical protein